MRKYLADAIYTYRSLQADILSRIQAGSHISDDDWAAYDRAKQLVRQQQVLWEDWDGLLGDEHDQVRDWAA